MKSRIAFALLAACAIGAGQVAKAKPDGCTLVGGTIKKSGAQPN